MKRVKVTIKGIVQGVGFRPFVYNLAKSLNLCGWVLNDGSGVEIEIVGKEELIDNFLDRLKNNPPPLSKIDSIEVISVRDSDSKVGEFKILDSIDGANKITSVAPDITLCSDCLTEFKDKSNKRYKHPFITCTNCGPRWSIIKDVPYDRVNTSMSDFKMCSSCKEEYMDPLDRRYHAQPISCWECGPTLELKFKNEELKTKFGRHYCKSANLHNKIISQAEYDAEKRVDQVDYVDQIFKTVANLLKDGAILSIKGVGGFYLVCDATNSRVVEELRVRKRRPAKPFAIMCNSLEMAKEYAQILPKEEELLTSNIRPIVLLDSKRSNLSNSIAPNIDRVGIVLPYMPIHYLLFENIDFPIVVTSANISGEPIIRDIEELEVKLGSVVDAILDYNREIVHSIDDSVVQVIDGYVQWIRVARGVAPLSIKLKVKNEELKTKFIHYYRKSNTINSEIPSQAGYDRGDSKPSNLHTNSYLLNSILAVGANQKSTIAITLDDKIIISPHIGDLDTIDSVEYFKRTIKEFKRFYEFEPNIIVSDLHPNYESVKVANELKAKNEKLKTTKVQHHFAHALAVMAEHNFTNEALCFSFDGTGFGSDGTLWGGEVFIANIKDFKRVLSLKQFKLLGGKRAIKETRRVALSLLFDSFSLDEVLKLNSPTIKSFKDYEIKLLHKSWKDGINTPQTSSIGRLFDAVASFADIMQNSSYEGESGMMIESLYNFKIKDSYSYKIVDRKIDLSQIVKEILKDSKEQIATKFINTIAKMVIDISKEYLEYRVVLCGGVFQNRTLVNIILNSDINKRLMLSKNMSSNDAAISLGQAYYGVVN